MPETNKPETGVPAELRGIVDIVYLSRENCVITEKNGFIGIKAIIDKPKDILAESESGKSESGKSESGKSESGKSESGKPEAGKSEAGKPEADKSASVKSEADKKDEKPAEPVSTDLPEGKIEKIVDRVFLSRAFPFDMPDEYISVLDKDKKEIGFIRSLGDFDEPERKLLAHELEAKYYTPQIKRILSVKERYGFSYWKTECDFGEKTFTLQDTFRSIIKSSNPDGSERVFILDVDGNRYEIPDVESLDRTSYKKIELYL